MMGSAFGVSSRRSGSLPTRSMSKRICRPVQTLVLPDADERAVYVVPEQPQGQPERPFPSMPWRCSRMHPGHHRSPDRIAHCDHRRRCAWGRASSNGTSCRAAERIEQDQGRLDGGALPQIARGRPVRFPAGMIAAGIVPSSGRSSPQSPYSPVLANRISAGCMVRPRAVPALQGIGLRSICRQPQHIRSGCLGWSGNRALRFAFLGSVGNAPNRAMASILLRYEQGRLDPAQPSDDPGAARRCRERPGMAHRYVWISPKITADSSPIVTGGASPALYHGRTVPATYTRSLFDQIGQPRHRNFMPMSPIP